MNPSTKDISIPSTKKLQLLLTWSEIQKGEKLLAGKLIPELVILHH
jgi:hypothetical protein